MMANDTLHVLALNEINFELVKKYILNDQGSYKGWEKLFSLWQFKTSSENEYANLEPWIQWVSVYSGKKYHQHGVFRLGSNNIPATQQLFNSLTNKGISVGAISPINAHIDATELDYYIPDPWVDDQPDGNLWSKQIHSALRQTVNDNASGKISFKSAFTLGCAFVKFGKLKNTKLYLLLIKKALKKQKWAKSLFLDLFLSDVYLAYNKKHRSNLNWLFLNSFAHIQHHYFFSSKYYDGDKSNAKEVVPLPLDPIRDAIYVYDQILLNVFKDKRIKNLLAITALSQVPYKGEKNYYRPRDHVNLLNRLELSYKEVKPRMTRDFEIIFEDERSLNESYAFLKEMNHNGNYLFGDFTKTNKKLFITFSYKYIINKEFFVKTLSGKDINIADEFVFIAKKNGEHCSKGYVASSVKISDTEEFKIINLKQIIENFFDQHQSTS